MDRAPSPVIHQVLPNEVLATIFEEHAKCEWNAPMIDERVCRFWRQIVLNTPRAWRYLEILDHKHKQPSIRELQSWLNRSGAVPLHIRIDLHVSFSVNGRLIYNLLSDYHARIASLRMATGFPSFFQGREFPCLRLLDITDWYMLYETTTTIHLYSLPELRSLRLHFINLVDATGPIRLAPLSDLASMELLCLSDTTFTSLVQHSLSLTTLMLDGVFLGDTISSPVDFPSLTYLSLYDVLGLKYHINAPCLATYHEGAATIDESFSTPLPSLVEYGVYADFGDLDPPSWHIFFPNISRLAIRAYPGILVSLLDSLSAHLRFLLVLRTISVGFIIDDILPTEDEQKVMKSLTSVRGEGCHMDVVLCFEEVSPFSIPIFFGAEPDFPW